MTAEDLRRGVRAQNAAGLERLARRIEPEVDWDDLVLAPTVLRGLQEVAARARHRDTVLTDWRMRRGGGRGHGVTALFAGDSGTGKTMSAEVIATDLRLDLYTVNLATVVDKYVGETEKNLERIFAEAAGVNAVLFFDEADAIFGKRSDVRDAHDRYANIESAYLLQRLETFDGLAVLATNLRANIDEAFTRRLDAIIDFPSPTPDLRRTLWAHCLIAPLPVDDDVDLDFLAESFEFAGGNIRSASTTAAYLAAAAGTPVTMAHLVAAVEQEYRKLGPAGAGARIRRVLLLDRLTHGREVCPIGQRMTAVGPCRIGLLRCQSRSLDVTRGGWPCTSTYLIPGAIRSGRGATGSRTSCRSQHGRAAAEGRTDVLGARRTPRSAAGGRQRRRHRNGGGRALAGPRRGVLGRPHAGPGSTRPTWRAASGQTSATSGCTTTGLRRRRPRR